MGNTNNTDKAPKVHSKPKALTKNKSASKSPDAFFIKLVHQNMIANTIDLQALDQRRYVFVSLLGLLQTWTEIPYISLYSALIVLPLKQDWLYNPSKCKEDDRCSSLAPFSSCFVELLKWKDSQGLIMWASDYNWENKTCDDLIHPFWHAFSDKLCSLYDPITGNKYNPLQFDRLWWRNFSSKYEVKTSSVLSELYFGTFKFDTMREVIWQSNPSLCPLKSYTLHSISQQLHCDIEIEESASDNGSWNVLEYDPCDIDSNIWE